MSPEIWVDEFVKWWDSLPEGGVLQRACEHCDRGLLYAPVRFCGCCGGSGFVVKSTAAEGVTVLPAPEKEK